MTAEARRTRRKAVEKGRYGPGPLPAAACAARQPAARTLAGRRRTVPCLVALLCVGLAVATSACVAGRGAPPTAEPPPDPRRHVLVAEHSTRLRQPSKLVFRWNAREPDFRGSGVGVARVEPPYRARLDLFLDNGESAAVAGLVGDQLRIPGDVSPALVPPPALLWAAFGVFRPGDDAEFASGRVEGGRLEVEYALPAGDRLRFRLRNGVVREAARLEDGAVVERVTVSGERSAPGLEGGSYPSDATYRNLPDVRELKLELESVEHVDPFPPDIWDPAGP